MRKESGSSSAGVHWKGFMGVVAGSTPTIYQHFEEVGDMGERFIYYRMKHFNEEKVLDVALHREKTGKELDLYLSGLYAEYIKGCGLGSPDKVKLSNEEQERIKNVARLAATLRTPIRINKYRGVVEYIPVRESPTRVMLQLIAIAKGLAVMNYHDKKLCGLTEDDLKSIEWCAYSLANEERRACLRALVSEDFGVHISTQAIADAIGLNTDVTKNVLECLAATGVVVRTSDGKLAWSIKDRSVYDIVRNFEKDSLLTITERESSEEEMEGGAFEEEWQSYKG